MNLRERCRYRCRKQFPNENARQLDRAADFAHDWFEANPEGTVDECREAMENDGNILVTIAVMSLVCQIAFELWRVFRDRKRK